MADAKEKTVIEFPQQEEKPLTQDEKERAEQMRKLALGWRNEQAKKLEPTAGSQGPRMRKHHR